MIEKMSKVYIAARNADKDRLLDRLGELGVAHVEPVDPDKAVADEKVLADIGKLQAAKQILSAFEPKGTESEISPMEAAEEAVKIDRDTAEMTGRLAALHHQIDQLALWGDVRLADLEQLGQAGIDIQFYSIAAVQLDEIQAECAEVITNLPDKQLLVAVIDRTGNAVLPEGAEPLAQPKKDRPSILAEAARIDQELKEYKLRLGALANSIPSIEKKSIELQSQADFTIVARSAVSDEQIFALQSWVPREKSEKLASLISDAGIEVAVRIAPPSDDEAPPTLIRYASWSKPIKGLFDMLGTLPGYRELDVTPFFMIALPLFAAILIGDAGYGLVFMVPPLIWYRKLVASAGVEKIRLLIVIGAFTLIWGILSANYFGITPESIASVGGYVTETGDQRIPDYEAMRGGSGGWASIGKLMMAVAPVWDADADKARELLIKLSFLFGCIHLTLAHIRQAVAYAPSVLALAQLGWCLFLWAMLGVIWQMFFGSQQETVPSWLIYTAGGIGAALFILFTAPHKNPLKRIGVGFASSLLPILGTFSDTMSYIRLMAVGMASYYIASAFNQIGCDVAEVATWFAAAPIVVFGHALNIALAIIAIFAHGVRLNMLEFSSNAGVQWVGYAYAPFVKKES